MKPQNTSDEYPPFRAAHSDDGRRHGGSWKVAYADFVTALMALFIVLWLMNTSRQVQENVSAYFRDPRAHARGVQAGAGQGRGGPKDAAATRDNAESIKRKLEEAIRSLPELKRVKDNIQISLSPEGMRIDLLETEQGLFFERARPDPSPSGVQMLTVLAKELSRLPNEMVIEGHTDARPYRYTALNGYSNWELSVDRANAARRCMQDHGVSEKQVVQVRGYADKRLLNPATPDSSRNRRVSVVVMYDSQAPTKSK